MDDEERQAIALHRWAVIAEATSDRSRTRPNAACWCAPSPQRSPHPSRWDVPAATAERHDRPLDPGLAGAAGSMHFVPAPRADTGTVRAHPELFDEAAALRLELPEPLGRPDRLDPVRTDTACVSPSARCASSCARRGLQPRSARRRAQGPSAATRPSDPTTVGSPTCSSGPLVPFTQEWRLSVRAKLLLDRRRPLTAVGRRRFFAHENARACQEAAAPGHRPAWSCPKSSMPTTERHFKNAWLTRTCAVLGDPPGALAALLARRPGKAGAR